MTVRIVYAAKRDNSGNITDLYFYEANDLNKRYSLKKEYLIADIVNNGTVYKTNVGGVYANIYVCLSTTPDESRANNMSGLPSPDVLYEKENINL